jgi:hypothetical protein
MCTVSWIFQSGGYRLYCNRDEKHTRQVALPPAVREKEGVRFVAPLDGDYGGTWIGVNQYGLSLCLLNRYQDEAGFSSGAAEYLSRGFLPAEFMDCPTRWQTRNRIERLDLRRYRPFTIVVLEPEPPPLLIHWTGRGLLFESNGETAIPLVSSSYDPEGVRRSRRRHFEGLLKESGKVDGRLLERFHRSHFPTASAYSTCMHRDDARTVSFSKINVTGDDIEFTYHADSPCVGARTDEESCKLVLAGPRAVTATRANDNGPIPSPR